MGYTQKQPNGKYRARWRDPDGRLRSKNFARERDAARHLRSTEVAIDQGRYMDEAGGKLLFAEWAEHYFALAQKRLARTTYARDVTWLNAYVLPRWGRTPLGKISESAVERWIADLGDEGKAVKGGTLAPTSVQDIYQTFRKVMKAAHTAGRIPRIPCPEHPPIARKKRKAIRFLAEAEVDHLAQNIDPLYEAMIFVAAYGGFRLGELCALRIDDVDWAHGYIRVDEGLTDVDGQLKFENPKSDRAFRTVPMADLALEKLTAHIELRVEGTDRRALLFAAPDGGVLRPNNWRNRHFNRAVSLAELAPLTPHDLRHTAASLFIAEGANPWMLAEILGHGDTRMIDRVYGHLFEKDRQALRDRMSRRAREASVDNIRRLPRLPAEKAT